MAYLSELYIGNFDTRDHSAIRNGSPAFASYPQNLAKNQHWLALTDTPYVNCMNGLFTSTHSPYEIEVEVPPFCNFAELSFFCVGSSTRTSATPAIVATAENTSTIVSVPGNSVSLSRERAGWVFMNNPNDSLPDTPCVLKLASAPSETWTQATISIAVDVNVHVYIAHYRVIPAVYYSVA